MTRIGFYPGSFDPLTLGHLDIASRAAGLFDRLVVGVGAHHDKRSMFSVSQRVAMLEREALANAASGALFDITTYDGLTVDAARASEANVIVRGLRNAADFDYEMQMAGMNAALAPEIRTIFIAASPETRHIAASLVRQIASMGGDVSAFVPASVAALIADRRALHV